MTIAKNAIRFSIVNYNGGSYLLENKFNKKNKIMLIDAFGKGIELSNTIELTIVFNPAELAMYYLNLRSEYEK